MSVVARATAPDAAALGRYLAEAKLAGCPLDQVYNFVRAGVVLFPKQLRASAAARLCDHRCPDCEAAMASGVAPSDECPSCGPTGIGMGGSRGPGKSAWLVVQMGLDDCQRYPELKCLLLRKVGKSNRENFGDLKRKFINKDRVPHTYREREGILEFTRNGSRIITGHFKDESEVDNYLGLEYDIIGIEESTTLSVQKKRDIRGCLRSTKIHPFPWRPRIYETTNPGGISHSDFKKTYILPMREGRERDTRFIQALPEDNPALNPEYRSRVLGRYTGWQYRAWARGDWDIESGQYFTNFSHEAHVRKARGFEVPPEGWDVWGALDHGLTHYTVFYLLCRDGDGNITVVDEHAARGLVPSQHAESIHSLLARRGLSARDLDGILAGHDCFDRRVNGDELGTYADAYAACGLPLQKAQINRINGARELYRRLGAPAEAGRAAVPPTLFILDSCPRLIECLPSMQRNPRNPEDVLKVDTDDEGEGGDDYYDCLRYGIMKYALSAPVSTAPSVVGAPRDHARYRVL